MTLLVGAVATAVAVPSTQSAPTGYPYPPPSPPPPPPAPTGGPYPSPSPPPAPATYTLSVTKAGTGTGSVTSGSGGIACGSDCSEAYAQGASATLTAAPGAGSTFEGWSGACTGAAMCTVTMDASKSVTATFTLEAGAQPGQPEDTTLLASVTRVEVVKRAGKRIVRAELSLEEAVEAELELKRRGRTLARKTANLSPGSRLVAVRVAADVAAGRATLRVLLHDDAGNEESFARSVRIPALGA